MRFCGELRRIPRVELERQAEAWLERPGTEQSRGKRVAELSMGMQQKVQLIVAVLHDPC